MCSLMFAHTQKLSNFIAPMYSENKQNMAVLPFLLPYVTLFEKEMINTSFVD